jgi:dipeptidyl aminopeptidase/acylaminoacyl peptidase
LVKTPTLIQAGNADIAVPISQAYLWCHALQSRNIPVKIKIYKNQNYTFNDPQEIYLGLQDIQKWLKIYLENN